MERPNEVQTEDWVDRQLTAFLHTEPWEPDTQRGFERLLERRESRRRRRVHAAWILGCLFAASAGAMTFPGTRAYADRCVQACVAETSRVGQFVLDRLRPGESRRPAPDFVLSGSDGRTVQLSAFRGKVVVLNFWATWCPPCLIEIPWFMDFQRKYADRGFSVIGVSLDEEGWEAVRPFLSKRGVNYPVVVGGDEVVQAYGGLDSLPTTLIIDRNGRVASIHMGLVSKSVYENAIQSILNEKR